MPLSNLLEVVKKEIRQLIRDKRTLALVLLQPVVIILFLGFCLHHDVSDMDAFVFIQETGNYHIEKHSQDILDVIEECEAFHITNQVDSTSKIYDAIRDGEARVGVICNSSGWIGFKLTFVYDSTNRMIDGVVKEGMANVSEELLDILIVQPQYFEVQSESHFGEYTYFESYTPGILCLATFWVCMSISSLSVIMEKTSGTIERLLTTPYSKVEIIVGKLIGNSMAAVSASITSISIVFWIFGADVKGEIPIILLVSILVGLVSLGHGLLISAFVESEREAVQITAYLFLIYLFLSNMFWPLENMHWSMAYARLGCFLTYAVNALDGIMLKGYSVLEVEQDLVILGIFGLFFLLTGILAFRRKITKT